METPARLDNENNALVVYWAGAIPAELSALGTHAAKLRLEPAKFSRKQLMAAAEKILPNGEGAGTVELAVDGSGITVATTDLPAAVHGLRPASPTESRLISRIAETQHTTGVPVTIAASRPATPAFDVSRFADQSPYWAGAVMSRCTSGFSMYASGSTSTRFTLTAAHCSNFTDGIRMDNGAGVRMGDTDFIHELYDHDGPSYDLGVVRLDAGLSNAPYIFMFDDHTEGAIAVLGYASGGIPANGNYCVHGTTAINCNLRSGGQIRRCTGWPPTVRCVYTIAMDSFDGVNRTWCRGDSGGPIYFWSGSGVIAAGVVSWSNHELGDCSRTGGASAVATAVNLISGLRVVTTSAP